MVPSAAGAQLRAVVNVGSAVLSYVACWDEAGDRRFVASDDWLQVRPIFESQAQLLVPGIQIDRLRQQYVRLLDRGGGINYRRGHPVGAFRAFQVEPDKTPDQFVCFLLRPRSLPILGPAAALDPIKAKLPDPSSYDVFTPADLSALGPRKEPPSESRGTARARQALKTVRADPASIGPASRGLSVGELLWIGHELRKLPDHRDGQAALKIADIAVQRGLTPGVLNLLGAALRDAALYADSETAYRESIELCESAGFNPYGYVGLAATLRRLDRPDDAYDEVKKALRFYPLNHYANETRDAILRDMHRWASVSEPAA
jgi:tetratricopeptide (TPR) repeat protein